MSLQFILGNSGCGKSTWLYETVIREAMESPKKDFLFLVPEQFTMQTQKEFVKRHPNHSILNIDVLSFQRLAYRVFDDLGMTDVAVLEETGKNLVLRKVAKQCEPNLKLLQGSIHKTGYISEMKSLLSELTQYHVSAEDLERVRDELTEKNALWYKLNDIVTLYEGFEQFLQGRYVTADELLDLLTKVAPESGMLRDSVVVLDGYTGFTPVQNHFLRELLPLAESVRIALTMDSHTAMTGEPKLQELFYMTKKTIRSVSKIAADQGVELLAPVMLKDGKEKRYANAPALFHLEQNLFRARSKNYDGKQDQIRIFRFFQPKDELRYVAGEIRRLVAYEGLRYVDIAVVTGDVPAYAGYAEEVFSRYDIPLFIDQKKPILFHPMIELVRAVLEMETANYSYESVMRCLRSGLTDLKADEIDVLENYLLAFHIRGWSMWSQPWVRPVDWLEEAELESLNDVKNGLLSKLEPFHAKFHARGCTVKDRTAALYGLLMSFEIPQQLEEQRQQFEQEGRLADARENEQIFGIVLALFDKLVELLGDEQVTSKEYEQILDAGLEASKVGIIPPGYDRVLFGDIERTRLEHIRVLFFIGVNDGIIPRAEGSGGILSEFERERLAAFEIELAPTAREKTFIQKFYLYLNMTKPSEKLYLTFSQAGQDGQSRRRSYLISALQRLFPQLEVEEPAKEPLVTPDASLQYFLNGLEEAKSGTVEERWCALFSWYLGQEEWKGVMERLLQAAFAVHKDTVLSRALTHELYGKVVEQSVTRLERFAGCAFAHFLRYGLQLQERQVSSFEPVDFGSILHQSLEQYGRLLQEQGESWFTIDSDRQGQLAAQALEAAILGCKNAALSDGERNSYLVHRMERVLRQTVETLGRQLKSGKFIPKNYEVSFQSVNDLNAVQFALSGEEQMKLQGRIDRVDVLEEDDKVYVKIIDYKSGRTNFQLLNIYHGLQLQLVVYLHAAMELLQREYPKKEMKPAGIFYYHIDDPMCEEETPMTEQEIKDHIFKKLKLDGYVNSDPSVYRQMDQNMQSTSDVLPVSENKDGTVRKSSKVASEQQFHDMVEFVSEKIAKLGDSMMQGDIAVSPYKLKEETACGYCPYRSVCGFDERLEGYRYRKLEAGVSDEELFRRMEPNNRAESNNRMEAKETKEEAKES